MSKSNKSPGFSRIISDYFRNPSTNFSYCNCYCLFWNPLSLQQQVQPPSKLDDALQACSWTGDDQDMPSICLEVHVQ